MVDQFTRRAITMPTLAEIASIMIRYGGLTFGGGAPTIAALEHQTVTRSAWLDPARLRLAFALSRLTPGTNLLAFCAALGWQMRGAAGAVVALVGASLPCSAIAVAFTIMIEAWQDNRWAMIAVAGASASAIGIVGASCWHLIRPHVESGARARTAIIVAGAVLLQAFDVSPIRVLLLAGIVGALWREPE